MQRNDFLHSPIRLSGSDGLNAAAVGRMGGEAGADLRYGVGGSIIEERFDVYLDTVAESHKLQNSRDGGEGQKGSPVVLQRVHVVDVTCIPEPVRDPCKWKHDCNEQAR